MKVDLPDQLYRWRQRLGARRFLGAGKRLATRLMGWVLARPRAYRAAGWLGRWGLRYLPARLLGVLARPWTRHRELPDPPRESFGEWYRTHHGRGPAL